MKDVAFLSVTLGIVFLTAFGSRWCSLVTYNRYLLLAVFTSMALIVGFNEYEVEIVGNSPIHAGLMSLCQYGALTLSAKIWFSINYPNFGSAQRIACSLVIHGGLLSLVVASYWFKKNYPLLPALMYPLASISLALVAETIEAYLHKNKANT